LLNLRDRPTRWFSEINAGIAQLVEQLICNQQVVGSNPTAGWLYFRFSTPKAFARLRLPSELRILSGRRGFASARADAHDAEVASAFFQVTVQIEVAGGTSTSTTSWNRRCRVSQKNRFLFALANWARTGVMNAS
jgi:hypothetical protein